MLSPMKRSRCDDDGDVSGDGVGSLNGATPQEDKSKAFSPKQTVESDVVTKQLSGDNSEAPEVEISPPKKRVKIDADAATDSGEEIVTADDVLSQGDNKSKISSQIVAKGDVAEENENATEEDEEEDEDFEIDSEDEDDSEEDEELDEDWEAEKEDSGEGVDKLEVEMSLPPKRVRRAVADTAESGEEPTPSVDVMSQGDKSKNSSAETAGKDALAGDSSNGNKEEDIAEKVDEDEQRE